MNKIRLLSIAVLCGVIFFASVTNASNDVFGAKAAQMNRDPSIEEMMMYAIQDEYLAHAEYQVIIEKFGNVRPFSNIIKAESNHINFLVDTYREKGMTVPEDNALAFIQVPGSLHEALAAGVQAEIDNIAMYQSFLENPLLAQSENSQLKSLFNLLMNASQNHLAAFKRNLKKYE